MRTSKKKHSKSTHGPTSSHNKSLLIDALTPLCDDVVWMNDIITLLKKTSFPDTHFEIAGLARKISYELIASSPNLLDSDKTHLLKKLLVSSFDQLRPLENTDEPFAKVAEKVFQTMQQESIRKKPSKSR